MIFIVTVYEKKVTDNASNEAYRFHTMKCQTYKPPKGAGQGEPCPGLSLAENVLTDYLRQRLASGLGIG